MAIVTETITITTTGANAGAQSYIVQVDTNTGAGLNPLSIPIVGGASGTSTVTATMPTHLVNGVPLTSNTAEIVWQPTNGRIAVTPVTITTYSNPSMIQGWPGGLLSPISYNPPSNSLVFNQVVANYPISGFGTPAYKYNPMVAIQQTSLGTYSSTLSIAGTITNRNSGSYPGFVLDCVADLVVPIAGTYTLYVNYANVSSFAVYIGGGATFSSQNYNGGNGGGHPYPTTGPASGFPLAIVSTNSGYAAHPNVVSSYITFPTPGIYPIEAIYNQSLSCQPSYDHNSYFQITYLAGAMNQNVGQSAQGSQFLPIALVAAPPAGATPTGSLRLTPTGGTAGLQVQGTTDTLTLIIQNVPYTSIPYIPILEGTPGHMFVYNSGTSFNFQTYNGQTVNTTAAAANVFEISGSNTGGIFNVTPSGSAFALNYNGGAFSFIGPGAQIASTNLLLTAHDIAWYDHANETFDLFASVGTQGATLFSADVDFLTKPTIQSVSPLTLIANDTIQQTLSISLSKPMSPQQQGLYGTGNTLSASIAVSAGATIAPLQPILDNMGYLQGWVAVINVSTSSTNGSLTLSMNVTGTLTYLSGSTFVTNTVTYISGPVATITTTGNQYVAPTAVSLTVSPGGSPLATNQTLAGTIYTLDNSTQTMVFYQKGTASGSVAVLLGTGVLTNAYTGSVGGQTVYYKTYSLSHVFSTVSVSSAPAADIYLGFIDTDTISGLSTTYYSTTVYVQPYTISSGGGGNGNGGGGCFTAAVAIKTPDGLAEFGDLPTTGTFEIENETGTHLAELVIHENYEGWMVVLDPDDKLVTIDHAMKSGIEWVRAEDKYEHLPQVWFEGTVYNLHVLTDDADSRHYILFNGDVAHNLKMVNQ